jgi:hypothetical protein
LKYFDFLQGKFQQLKRVKDDVKLGMKELIQQAANQRFPKIVC